MRIEEATEESVWLVARNMREEDLREILATQCATTRAQLAEQLAAEYGSRPDAIVAWHERCGPVAAGAGVMVRPNVVQIGMFATPDFPKIVRPLTRFVTDVWFPAYRQTGVHRISCTSISDYWQAHRWIGMLGLTREADLPGFGKNGEMFTSFAWVSDACQVGPRV